MGYEVEWIARGWGVGPKVLTDGVRVDVQCISYCISRDILSTPSDQFYPSSFLSSLSSTPQASALELVRTEENKTKGEGCGRERGL